jgi:hypothetical protein
MGISAQVTNAVGVDRPDIRDGLPTAVKADAVTAGFRDPSFGHNKQYPIHRWVPWVAGFSAHFVHDCLRSYVSSKRQRSAWVLDPFAGVGTTLVESFLHGYNVLGFEINPYAVLASKSKLEAAKVSKETLADCISQYELFMKEYCGSNGSSLISPQSQVPAGFSGRTELYSPNVLRKVLFTLDFVNSIHDAAVRDLFRLAFGAVMVSFSNYTYEPSLTRRAAVGKALIDQADVASILVTKLSATTTQNRAGKHIWCGDKSWPGPVRRRCNHLASLPQ